MKRWLISLFIMSIIVVLGSISVATAMVVFHAIFGMYGMWVFLFILFLTAVSLGAKWGNKCTL